MVANSNFSLLTLLLFTLNIIPKKKQSNKTRPKSYQMLYFVLIVWPNTKTKTSNFFQMRQLRNAPPSNIVKNKSDKVNFVFRLFVPFMPESVQPLSYTFKRTARSINCFFNDKHVIFSHKFMQCSIFVLFNCSNRTFIFLHIELVLCKIWYVCLNKYSV